MKFSSHLSLTFIQYFILDVPNVVLLEQVLTFLIKLAVFFSATHFKFNRHFQGSRLFEERIINTHVCMYFFIYILLSFK